MGADSGADAGPRRRRARTGILSGMALYDIPVHTLQGDESALGEYVGKTLLVVNVASKCGLTPQYEGLERLQKTYGDRAFSVVGFPSNQFMGQEPGTAEEIQQFCSTTYGVTFPMFEKIDVNGDDRHPIYEELTAAPDAEGTAGDITWNFEKFLVSGTGEVIGRFRPQVEPEDPAIVDAIEAALHA
jgi:glutathione peroxidase